MKQPSPEPAEMLFGRFGGGGRCSRLSSCFKGNPPELLESVFANFHCRFHSDTTVSRCEKEAAWPDMQTELIILAFSNGSQDTSFCISFLSAEKNLNA